MGDIQGDIRAEADDLARCFNRAIVHADEVDVRDPADEGILSEERAADIDADDAAVLGGQQFGVLARLVEEGLTGDAHFYLA